MVSNYPPNGRNPQDPHNHDGRRRFDSSDYAHNKPKQPASFPAKPLPPIKPTTPIAKSRDGDQFITEQPSLSQGPNSSDNTNSSNNAQSAKSPDQSTKNNPPQSPPASPKLRLAGTRQDRQDRQDIPSNQPNTRRKQTPTTNRRPRTNAPDLKYPFDARTPFGSSEPAASNIAVSGVMLDLTPIGQPINTASDPRWVLALRSAEALQGSVLAPEKRQKLIRLGKVMGMTAFDANLVIAIIQDQARRGYAPDYCPTAGEPQLQMVPLPRLASVIRSYPGRRAFMLACAIASVLASEIIFFNWWLGS